MAVTTTLLAAPAQAATAGSARVLGKHHSIVSFTAESGQANSLVITVSGRTITLDDRVAVKPGRGCKAVKGDRTKVRCTTSRKPTELSVTLGIKNDKVYNKTAVPMVAEGDSGNDTLSGGSNRDRLFGGGGDDKLYGGAGNDAIDGGQGNDTIYGQAGKDYIYGGPGNDKISGGAGNDTLTGGPGKDKISGGPGKDEIAH